MKNRPTNSLPITLFYHWVLGRRLQDLGMTELAEKHLQQASQLDPGGQTPSER
jgi:hypothetical protein